MNLNSLQPARDFAQQFGCKSIVYGPPGTAKTPGINNAPRPVLLACEPGLLSMRTSNVPTFCAFTPQRIDEFFNWFFNSNETKHFDTLGIDSISQMADIYLQQALRDNKHGLKAYGEMATNTMKHLRTLYYMPQKHTYLVCKEERMEGDYTFRRPFFPGKQLPVDIPHMYDFVLRLSIEPVPNVGQVSCFRCIGSMDTMARNRTGNLNEFEAPHIGQLYQKAMS